MTKTDTIERTITVASPVEKVWEALTVADKLAQWFGDSADIDLRPGGAMRIGWSEFDTAVDAVVESVEPPCRLSYRWEAGRDAAGVMWTTLVTFTVDEDEGTTTVTVVESGLASLPDELHDRTLEENSSGWTEELADLRRFLEPAAVA